MNKKKTTKQLIIEILAEEFPLGVKQIYLKLKKSKKVTYQAIHKALTELVDSKKVIAKERLYYLNKKWIAEQTDFMSLTYNNYFQKNFISSEFKPNQDIQVIQFSSLKEILKFVQGFYKQYNNSTKQKIIIQARNLYPVTSMLSVLSSSKLKEFCKKNDIYLLIRNNSIADKWTAKFLRTFHINVKTGKSITHYNSIAIGDFVIQWHIFFSDSFRKDFHASRKKFRKKLSLDLFRLSDKLINHKVKVMLIFNKNPTYVKDMKKTALDLIKKS